MIAPKLSVTDQERRAWSVACAMETFTVYSLSARAQVRVDLVRKMVPAWGREGRAVCEGKGARRRHVWRVTGGRRMPALTHSPTENMWRTMRHLGSFTPADVKMIACTPAAPVSDEDAQSYCRMLMRAGYLRVLRPAQPGRAAALYALDRNTGPRAPVERRVRAVWDPNTRSYPHVPEPTS